MIAGSMHMASFLPVVSGRPGSLLPTFEAIGCARSIPRMVRPLDWKGQMKRGSTTIGALATWLQLDVPQSDGFPKNWHPKKNKYCRSKAKPGFRLGIWGLDDVWWELALRIPHSWLENWRLGVGPNPLSQPRPFCSFLGCVMPEFFFGVLTTTKCEKLMATLVG